MGLDSTARSRPSARPITPPRPAGRRSRPGAIFGCCSWATSRAWTASAASPGPVGVRNRLAGTGAVELVSDKGYHAREVLKRLADGRWQTRIAEPARRSVLRWHGDSEGRRAVYANRARLLSGVARVALLLRAVLCERAFAHILDRGGMRRTWLRGRDNVAKRYLVQVAGYNLRLLMRTLFGAGTLKAAADAGLVWLAAGDHLLLVLLLCLKTGPRRVRDATKPQPIGRSCVGRSDSRSRP